MKVSRAKNETPTIIDTNFIGMYSHEFECNLANNCMSYILCIRRKVIARGESQNIA